MKHVAECPHCAGRYKPRPAGGAGPLLAADIARELGIATVIVSPSPGILCAEGLLNSDLTADFVKTALMPLTAESYVPLTAVRADLTAMAHEWFDHEKVPADQRRLRWTVEMRYKGQNYELSLPIDDADFDGARCTDLARAFHGAHERTYGFFAESETVEFVNMKVKAVAEFEKPALPVLEARPPAAPVSRRATLFSGAEWHDTPVYHRDSLAPGQELVGPAIVEQLDTTTPVFPGDTCVVDTFGNLIISLTRETPP